MTIRRFFFLFLFLTGTVQSNKAQTTLWSENFDSVTIPALPAGWVSTTVSSSTWRTDSSNSSSGYTGATALNNMFVRNSDPSGTYVLTSPAIATTNAAAITLQWASRVSINFLASGSATPVLEYSIDGGSTWTGINYTENPANSVWALVNGGTPILLPANTAHQADLRFRWTVQIVNNNNGTYRMDDIQVQGNTVSGMQNLISDAGIQVYPNPCTNSPMHVTLPANLLSCNAMLYTSDGRLLQQTILQNGNNTINLDRLTSGMYVMQVQDEQHNMLYRTVISR